LKRRDECLLGVDLNRAEVRQMFLSFFFPPSFPWTKSLYNLFIYNDLLKILIIVIFYFSFSKDYLADEEFGRIFKMDRTAFSALPAWKRTELKRRGM